MMVKNPKKVSPRWMEIRKPRKPYITTKERDQWTEDEKKRFLEALELYESDRESGHKRRQNWSKIQAHVGTRSAIQIRSRAQKHFARSQGSSTNSLTTLVNVEEEPDPVTDVISSPPPPSPYPFKVRVAMQPDTDEPITEMERMQFMFTCEVPEMYSFRSFMRFVFRDYFDY
jgi:hypothetical protein